MKIQKAYSLLKLNISEMSLEQLQRYKVSVIDAWRESTAAYGFKQAVANGFYVVIINEYSSGYSPKDMWLTQNLNYRLNEIDKIEHNLLT